MHTYLTTVREVSYTTENSDPVTTEATNIRRLTRRMTSMTNSNLTHLRDADHITFGELQVLLDMRILCEDCGAQYQVSDLLEARAWSARVTPTKSCYDIRVAVIDYDDILNILSI